MHAIIHKLRGTHHIFRICLRMLLVFVLTFSLSWGIQAAFADDDTSNSPSIIDIALYTSGTTNWLCSSSSGTVGEYSISSRGETLTLDSEITWGDYSQSRNDYRVTWEYDDWDIATFDASTQTLTPIADGTVEITATVTDDSIAGGSLSTTLRVTIVGQSDTPYVVSLRIEDADGNTAEPSFVIDAETNPNMILYLYAVAEVYDPVTDTTTEYSTRNGSLSSQVSGLSDVTWTLAYDDSLSYIEADQGIYRALSTDASNEVIVYTYGGLGNTRVEARAGVTVATTDSGWSNEGNHPQDTLTIRVYYEEAPDPDYIYKEITFDIADLEAMGTELVTYSMNGGTSRGWVKVTGYGVSFWTLLQYAEIDMDNIHQFTFGTYDNYEQPVTASYLFGVDRYYLPNADYPEIRFAEAVQVYPMIAIEDSGLISVDDTERGGAGPWYELRENDRFHLLMGCELSENQTSNTSYAIKWINTINVYMYGAPAVSSGDGTNSGTGSGSGDGSGSGSGTGSGSGSGSGDGDGSGSGTGAEGTGTGSEGSGLGTAAGGDSEGSSEGGSSGSGSDSGSSDDGTESSDTEALEEAGSGTEGGESGSGTAWSIYQIMNQDDTVVDQQPTLDNPWSPFVLPLAAAFCISGGVEYYTWWRRESAPLVRARGG